MCWHRSLHKQHHRDLNHSLIHTYTHTLQATVIAFHLSYWALICVRRCIMSGDMETRGGRRLSNGLFTARFISLKYTILYWASLLGKVRERKKNKNLPTNTTIKEMVEVHAVSLKTSCLCTWASSSTSDVLWRARFRSKLSYLRSQLYDSGTEVHFQTLCEVTGVTWKGRGRVEWTSTARLVVVYPHNPHSPTHPALTLHKHAKQASRGLSESKSIHTTFTLYR